MPGQDKRRSDRAIPFVSDEDVVVIHQDGQANALAKIMDLSEVGTLVYLIAEGDPAGSAVLSICHRGRVFQIPASIVRKNGRLIAFEFADPSPDAIREIQAKLIRMEIDWMRLRGGT